MASHGNDSSRTSKAKISSKEWARVQWIKKCIEAISKIEDPHEKLHYALKYSLSAIALQLLNEGVKPCTTNRSTNCFFLAQSYCPTFLLKEFLEIEPSGVNCQDSEGLTMLMLSNREQFELLCKYKQNVNLLNDEGDSILFYLLKTDPFFASSTVEKLVKIGVDVNSVNNKGETALLFTIKEKPFCFTPITAALLQAGAKVPPLHTNDESILSLVIQAEDLSMKNKIDFLENLMKCGVDVSSKDSEGRNFTHYIIKEHFKQINSRSLHEFVWECELENILIMLLQHKCEVQGLFDETFKRMVYAGTDHHYFIQNLDIIATFARYRASVNFLKELVERGLYNSKTHRELQCKQETVSLSPLSAYLCYFHLNQNSCNNINYRELLENSQYLISIGVDVTHRCMGQNLQFHSSEHCPKRHGTNILQVSNDLILPDALFFLADIRHLRCILRDLNVENEPNNLSAFEELLRLLLCFWPYPPLYLLSMEMDCECVKVGRNTIDTTPDLTFYSLLVKIGGAVPLGPRFYNSIIPNLENEIENRNVSAFDVYPVLAGVPSIRDLSRAAFRATVKKTCPTGLDFSEYRVLCQGEMVPLPKKIVNYLQFKN